MSLTASTVPTLPLRHLQSRAHRSAQIQTAHARLLMGRSRQLSDSGRARVRKRESARGHPSWPPSRGPSACGLPRSPTERPAPGYRARDRRTRRQWCLRKHSPDTWVRARPRQFRLGSPRRGGATRRRDTRTCTEHSPEPRRRTRTGLPAARGIQSVLVRPCWYFLASPSESRVKAVTGIPISGRLVSASTTRPLITAVAFGTLSWPRPRAREARRAEAPTGSLEASSGYLHDQRHSYLAPKWKLHLHRTIQPA